LVSDGTYVTEFFGSLAGAFKKGPLALLPRGCAFPNPQASGAKKLVNSRALWDGLAARCRTDRSTWFAVTRMAANARQSGKSFFGSFFSKKELLAFLPLAFSFLPTHRRAA
jgi:hypothetical protein